MRLWAEREGGLARSVVKDFDVPADILGVRAAKHIHLRAKLNPPEGVARAVESVAVKVKRHRVTGFDWDASF